MAQGEKLGYANCALCSYPVVIRENKRGLAYYSCEDCGSQHLARGPESHRKMLDRITRPIANSSPKNDEQAPAAGPKDKQQTADQAPADQGGEVDEFII